MKSKLKMKFLQQASAIKALSHPTRLLIVNMLSKRDICVCELTKAIGNDISTVSKHLSVLKNAGLVDINRKGNRIFYKLKCPCILEFMSCVAKILEISAKEKRRHI
ncbi:MAG: metalloregulator ArsR/SmtB family transcription factor [Elusimicrobia bacterium]|nr:metalloregulator ArsR/SmtB family transcription factor [Elusimicrobiota bacterium]